MENKRQRDMPEEKNPGKTMPKLTVIVPDDKEVNENEIRFNTMIDNMRPAQFIELDTSHHDISDKNKISPFFPFCPCHTKNKGVVLFHKHHWSCTTAMILGIIQIPPHMISCNGTIVMSEWVTLLKWPMIVRITSSKKKQNESNDTTFSTIESLLKMLYDIIVIYNYSKVECIAKSFTINFSRRIYNKGINGYYGPIIKVH